MTTLTAVAHHGVKGGWGALAAILIILAVIWLIGCFFWALSVACDPLVTPENHMKVLVPIVVVWAIVMAGFLTGAALALSAGYS